MENANVFEIQTLKDGRWMIEQRCRSEDEAVAEARDLYDSRHFESVKVVKEAFDQAAKLFRETTVFSLPNGGKSPIMVTETKITAPSPKNVVKPKTAKPKKRSFFDFLRE